MDTHRDTTAPIIAVVDDDPVVGALLRRVLTQAGYSVVVYHAGEPLLEHIGAVPIDLVCLDMSLPGLNGLETLSALRSRVPLLPVILFTAAADEIADEARQLGAFACLAKTGAWGELRVTVAAALATRA